MDTKGKVIENHLNDILERYFRFKSAVLEAYKGLEFDREKFTKIYGEEYANAHREN